MHRFFTALQRVLNHPWVKVVIALCLVATAGLEILKELEETEAGVGAHHGVFVYGVAIAVSAIAEAGAAAVEAHEAFEASKSSE